MTSLHRKFFGWFGILVLTLACAPGMVTPVPTLDPNALNTAIVQTANAASTKTAAAIQALPVSPTFAPTLTHEPTFTAVPHIVFPTLTTEPRVQYFRIKHDSQLAMYNYQSRTADPEWNVAKYGWQTPEVFQLTVGLSVRSGTNRTDVSGRWENFIDSLNDFNSKKLFYLKADNTALFNGTGFPQLESLTMGGNLITLVEIQSGWGRVRTMSYTNPGPFDEISYKSRPDLVHKFVIVGWRKPTRRTYLTNPPPPYNDIYYPLVSSRDVWIPMELLEPFPFLPMQVTAKITQPVREEPRKDSPLRESDFSEGETADLIEYFPSGSEVWGRLSNSGWVVLFMYQRTGPTYFTSWEMETTPPFPSAD